MAEIKTIEWGKGKVRLIDQTKLPLVEKYVDCREWQEVAEAIKSMKIRGAPAIGVAAALGIALGAKNSQATNTNDFLKEFEEICEGISATRPTARNLFWAVERMRARVQSHQNSRPEGLKQILEEEALKILKEDIEINEEMGKIGAELLKDGDNILTHCNAGALATAGYGTALGVIRAAFNENKQIHIFVDETRPLLQGARLTAWELKKEGIPFTLITDNMAGFLMSQGKIEKVIVGADRIVANGDVANKIGTYSVAVLAKENGIPFYVAAPRSTLDLSMASGEKIPVEERGPQEVTQINGSLIAPAQVKVRNPAFDITPHSYISAIITEVGIAKPPFGESLRRLAQKN